MGETPLIKAAMSYAVDTAAFLIERGANINAVDYVLPTSPYVTHHLLLYREIFLLYTLYILVIL